MRPRAAARRPLTPLSPTTSTLPRRGSAARGAGPGSRMPRAPAADPYNAADAVLNARMERGRPAAARRRRAPRQTGLTPLASNASRARNGSRASLVGRTAPASRGLPRLCQSSLRPPSAATCVRVMHLVEPGVAPPRSSTSRAALLDVRPPSRLDASPRVTVKKVVIDDPACGLPRAHSAPAFRARSLSLRRARCRLVDDQPRGASRTIARAMATAAAGRPTAPAALADLGFRQPSWSVTMKAVGVGGDVRGDYRRRVVLGLCRRRFSRGCAVEDQRLSWSTTATFCGAGRRGGISSRSWPSSGCARRTGL